MTVIFLYDIIFTQTNIGLIPFVYMLRLENESQCTEVTLTSSKYLSFYCFDFEHTAHNNFVLIIMSYTCYQLLSCTTLNNTTNRGNYFCKTQKNINTWKISGMLIVEWPITIKFRTCEQASKAQTNYHCCLQLRYLTSYRLFPRNTITFHKYFWYSWFCAFHVDIWAWLFWS